MIDVDNLINPIDKKKLDKNSIEYFNEIPDLFINDQNSLTSTQSSSIRHLNFSSFNIFLRFL